MLELFIYYALSLSGFVSLCLCLSVSLSLSPLYIHLYLSLALRRGSGLQGVVSQRFCQSPCFSFRFRKDPALVVLYTLVLKY